MAGITLFYQNVRGLRTKTSTFRRNICLNSYDVVCLAETWLLEGIRDSELFDDRYLVWRRDRKYSDTNQRLGGGVLIAVRRTLVADGKNDWCSSAEDIWVTLTLQHQKPKVSYYIHICTVYMCQQNMGNSFSDQLRNFSDKLVDIVLSHATDKFIILGDFNLPNINWVQKGDSTLCADNVQGVVQTDFIDKLSLCNLLQYNSNTNCKNRILDLVFSNNEISITNCKQPLVPEDPYHKSLCITADFVELHTLHIKPRVKFIYNNGDYSSISNKLDSINWDLELNSRPLEEACEFFYNVIYDLRTQYIPIKSVKPTQIHPPWYKSPLLKMLKEKHKYHSKFKKYKNKSDYNSFVLLRERAKVLESEMFENYINIIENNIRNNPQAFWSYVKSLNQMNSYPSVMNHGQCSSGDGNEICNMFAKYFHSTFSQGSYNDTSFVIEEDTRLTSNITPDIVSIEIDSTEVHRLLKNLDVKKSAGPDTIPATLIIKCARSLVVPLSLLYTKSFREGIVPSIWKSVYITPIHKKGAKNQIENYRPISKLCLFAKILEKIVHRQLYAVLKQSFSNDQHGFLKNKSTVSNLVLCSDYLSKYMSEPSQVDVIYTDYMKAFDRIDHLILLRKLLLAGIRGNLFRWFCSYIFNRNQTVVLNGYKSSKMLIPSGIPQGSLLGPLLFTIFINDISQCFTYSKILLFADDVKILHVIRTPQDAVNLQKDLNAFQKYCAQSKLNLNVSKCFICSFTRKPNPIKFDYTINGTPLTRVNTIKDLGVTFDAKLLFDTHINNIVSKASKALGFIIRVSQEFKNMKTLKILYCTFVRCHLEYVSQVWNPNYHTYINRIEAIQKRFLRFLQYRSKQFIKGYKNQCLKYHILPLQERRRIADMAYLFNIVNGSVDSPELLGNIAFRVPRLSTRNPAPLCVPSADTNYRQNAFFIRASRCLNAITKECNLDLFNTNVRKLKRDLTEHFFFSSNKLQC